MQDLKRRKIIFLSKNMIYKDIRMEKILVFRTSVDSTIQKLFNELGKIGDKDIDCLIQSSKVQKYKEEYPYINFIDIQGERFENLSSEVIKRISKKMYDRLYITLTGVDAYNFWNIMEILSNVHFKKGFFYNCNGEKMKIPRENIIKDTLCRIYIKLVGSLY